MENTTTTTTLHSNESFPKRIRSVSARIFSMNNISDHYHGNNNSKRSSCQIISSSPDHHINILNPSKWFPRIRCRSSSSASSTFSLVFSNTAAHQDNLYYHSNSSDDEEYDHNSNTHHHVSLEELSSQLEELYNIAKEELAYAVESQGSIYYEGDKMTAQSAFDSCIEKYDAAMLIFGESANSIKFRFRWEADLSQLRLTINALPQINHSIYD